MSVISSCKTRRGKKKKREPIFPNELYPCEMACLGGLLGDSSGRPVVNRVGEAVPTTAGCWQIGCT